MESDETEPRVSTRRPPQQPSDSSASAFAGFENKRKNRRSLRVRPTEILENAEPPSPLKDFSLKSAPLPSNSKMSLFNLFSRPKVEKARGYAEAGLETASPVQSKAANASKHSLVVQVEPAKHGLRSQSSMSFRKDGAKSASKSKGIEPIPPLPRERKAGFEPPPLFQAYPQSTKDGTLEMSTMSTEQVLQKTKSRRAGSAHTPALNLGNQDPMEDSLSTDTKRTGLGHLKHVANGSTTQVELPKKIFVLVTSGYLLQYAESGPSDRLPERMLHLGKESAAFACDLVPGKHYVLQVSQAVDQEGIVIANSGSIFTKIGIRSAATKRMTSTFLLVMPSGKEMESWMSAIRREIEALGGTRMRPDTAVRPKTSDADNYIDLKKTPSQSHRYQVKRSPSKIGTVTSPGEEIPQLPVTSPKIEKDTSDTATIDGIEEEASKLAEEETSPPKRNRSPSDAPSAISSVAVSVEQQHLNNLRSSLSNSNRMSRTSQAPTVATTAATSRTNSLTGSPPSDHSVTGSLESPQECLSKPGYRMLASYGVNRRRSAVPLRTTKEAHVSPSIDTSPRKAHASRIEASIQTPGAGRNTSGPQTSPQKQRRLTLAHSEPDLQAATKTREKHDSKMPMPPMVKTGEDERPESFVGDLPDPSTWSSNKSLNRRTSMTPLPPPPPPPMNPPPAVPKATTTPPATSPITSQQAISRTPETYRPKRMSTFSMPLKVNPSGPHSQLSSSNQRRSTLHDPEAASETPTVHTLTAKVDSTRRVSVSQASTNPQSTDGHQKSPSVRLSLFPSPLPSPPNTSPDLRTSPLATTPQTAAQPQAAGQSLRRPTSMQVRSDHAPFLSSVRNSTGPPAARSFTAPAVPIRGLKPSRSASNVPSLIVGQPSLSDPLKDLKFDLPPQNPPLQEEAADQATPLPQRSASPLPHRPGSRTGSWKAVRTRSSLPELDLGIPVVGLGPPAPPPSAPLPAPPPGSRPPSQTGSRSSSRPVSRAASPTPTQQTQTAMVGIDGVAGLGIRVS